MAPSKSSASTVEARGSSPSVPAPSSRGTWPTSWWRETPGIGWTSCCSPSPSEDPDVNVVVAGAGKMGRHLTTDLAERGHDVTLIEQEMAPAGKARQEVPDSVTIILGDACE